MSYICPPDHAHGARLGCYTGHDCRCAPCRATHADYLRQTRKLNGTHVTVDAAATRDRLRALAAMGYGPCTIAEGTGLHKSRIYQIRRGIHSRVTERVALQIARYYRDHAFTPPPRNRQTAAVIRRARAQGWPTPITLETAA